MLSLQASQWPKQVNHLPLPPSNVASRTLNLKREGVMLMNPSFTYQQAGVDTDQASTGLKGLLYWVTQTHALRQDVGGVRLPIGYYANVVDIGHGIGLAISTDGVGSKLLVA